ncbi:MAG: haloacid dehalogenase-like hydrolase [Acidobacteriota bacterium]
MRPFAAELEVEHVIGTELETRDGLFIVRTVGPVRPGEDKEAAVRDLCRLRSIDPSTCHACGDHPSDVRMLEAVGRASVAPGSDARECLARARGWPILGANDAERDLRHIETGRKGWLAFGSERGGEVAARLYSLVLSCQQSGVDPETYVTDVLGRIATTPHSKLATSTHWG